MKQSSTFRLLNLKSYLNLVLWLLLIVFASRFVIKDALPYFGFDQQVLGRYWNIKWWLILHVVGGILALGIGPFQFWKSFRIKYLKTHRWLGRIYLSSILIASISSTYLAWTSALAIHWTWAIGLQGLAVAWLTSAVLAYVAIRRKRIQQHKEWMIRSYVVTFAFVSFRWLVDLPFIVELGNFIERAPTVVWVSWVLPLYITEIVLQWNKKA